MNFWFLFGLAAQSCFASRFLVQWIVSERRKVSYIPMAFWYLSLCGGLGLLVYAIHIGDTVFILGQSFGVVVYTRNIMLRRRAGQGSVRE